MFLQKIQVLFLTPNSGCPEVPVSADAGPLTPLASAATCSVYTEAHVYAKVKIKYFLKGNQLRHSNDV